MELKKSTSCDSHFSFKLEKKKRCEVTYLNWKGKTKEHMYTEEALYNLSCDNVYLLLVSFCRCHENFGLN